MQLLVVDDHPEVLDVVSRALAREGHTVREASTSRLCPSVVCRNTMKRRVTQPGKETLADAAPHKGIAVLCGILICAMVAVDVATGIELHVYGLYFLPVSVAAWYGRRWLWLLTAILSAFASVWAFNLMGGQYSTQLYLVGNVLTQLVAYSFVGALTENVRRQNLRDRWWIRHDALTGLLNRDGLRERLEAEVGVVARTKCSLTIAYVDLDNFKVVNDTRGHAAGDEVLGLVARVISLCLRQTDAAARVGGDEFAIVLPEAGVDVARAALERIRLSVETEMRGIGCPVTASVGAFTFRQVPGSVDSLLAQADQQMYQVKRSGKNRTVVLDLAEGSLAG